MTRIHLRRGERIISMDPWAANGPGWANAGVTVQLGGHYTEENGELAEDPREVTIYAQDMAIRTGTLFPLAVVLMGALRRVLLAEHFTEPSK